MGLPVVNIDFTIQATSAVQRSAQGVVLLVLRDETNKTFTKKVYKTAESAVATDWTAENLDYIQKTFLGTPSAVICYRLNTADVLTTVFSDIARNRFDYLAMPKATVSEVTDLVTWIKARRDTDKKTFKLVVANATSPNHEGIINFTTSGIKVGAKTYTAADYTTRIAGILAGLPFTRSATYYVLPEVESVIESALPNTDIDDGKLILLHDGEKVKIARGVNSLTTLGTNKKADWKKIKVIEVLDMIRDDIRNVFENLYVGKYPNIYDNQVIFVTAINDYFADLAGDAILDNRATNVASIDVKAQRAAWDGVGVDTSKWDDQKVKETAFQSNLYLTGSVKPVDAMEDLTFSITV